MAIYSTPKIKEPQPHNVLLLHLTRDLKVVVPAPEVESYLQTGEWTNKPQLAKESREKALKERISAKEREIEALGKKAKSKKQSSKDS